MSEPEDSPIHPTQEHAALDAPAAQRRPDAASARSARSPRERFERLLAARREGQRQHEPEESLWSGGFSSRAMVGGWVAAVAITIGLLVASFVFPPFSFTMALAILGILWLLMVANYLRMSLGYHYELTSQRLIHKTGLITRHSDRIEVIDIDDVSYQQGPVQRLFGVGTITIISSDRSHPELNLLGIAKVGEVAGLIDDVRRAERRRRALHIEAI